MQDLVAEMRLELPLRGTSAEMLEGDLSEICERCADQTYRTACEDTVDENVQDVCNARIGTYNTACPYVPEESSTSSGTSS